MAGLWSLSIALGLLLASTVTRGQETGASRTLSQGTRAFLGRHCTSCHGADEPEAGLRLDVVAARLPGEAASWRHVVERITTGDMPPLDEPRPGRDEIRRVVTEFETLFRTAGGNLYAGEWAFPSKGNVVPHDWLFTPGRTEKTGDGDRPASTPARIWRVNPVEYRSTTDGLTNGLVGLKFGRIGSRGKPVVAVPFGLTTDAGIRDYAFRYRIAASEIERLAMNARLTLELGLKRRGPRAAARELTDLALNQDEPTDEQVAAAVRFVFERALRRGPTEDEAARYEAFVRKNVERLGNEDGAVLGLSAVLLHPEAVFRLELGRGEPDEHGRVMLAPLEIAHAISHALRDAAPDEALIAAVREGRLETRDDVEREVRRRLADPEAETPTLLRFLREYFGYASAPDVFKDDSVVSAAKIGRYYPDSLVEDTDRLVLHVLERDRQVLRELLTTPESFVSVSSVPNWVKFAKRREEQARAKGEEPAKHPFDKKNRLNELYGLAAENWRVEMPLPLDSEQRAGVLTQPAWLIAHSTNTDNHAIHRGKWIRERLLGGSISDTPITVDAQLPDEPHEQLRHRMRVTREEYCWQCHRRMDPLGLPFQMFDHFGRHRTEELGRSVDSSGAVFDTGLAELDGPVENAVELVHRLAKSERVEQVFVRHAFRFWTGRNETPADGPVLRAAHAAYAGNDGSLRELVASLLVSDAFLFRTVVPTTNEEPKSP